MRKADIGGFTRISKRTAEKLYDTGNTIRICACKMSPTNPWGEYSDASNKGPTTISEDGFNTTIARDRTFETVINAFRFYNCSYKTGYYPAFYVRKD